MAGSSTEQLILDILTRDRASEGLSRIGKSAAGASGDVSGLVGRLDEVGRKSVAARVAVDGNKEATAALDRIDAKLIGLDRKTARPDITVEGAARAAAEISAVDLELDKLKAKSEETAGTSGLGALIGTGGGGGPPGGAMGALIGAGVVLSPMLITLGFGLSGVAAAAIGAAKPIENAAQKTGGLQANMAKLNPEQQQVARSLLTLGGQFGTFEKQMQPQMLGLFNDGLRLASHLLSDTEPVAKATASALGGMLGQIDREFQGGEWKSFFGWMAQQAGPDVRELGGLFTALLQDLPPLVQGLQPLANGLLGAATDAAKLDGVASRLHADLPLLGIAVGAMAGGPVGAAVGGLTGLSLELMKVHTAFNPNAFGPAVSTYIEYLQKLNSATTADKLRQDELAASLAATSRAAYLTVSPTDHLGKVASAAGDASWYLSKGSTASGSSILHLGSVTQNTVTSTGHFTQVAKPLTVTLYDWSLNASRAAIQTVNMANAVSALNTAQAKALGNLVTYSGDILTTANDAVGLRKALAASGDQIGTHTATQRASFQAANTFITDLSSQAQAAIASGKGIDGASRAISTNLPLLDSAKTKSRLYWQEVQTLTSWLHKLQDMKNIREVVVVTGTGSWTMHNPANQSLPGSFPGGVGAATGMFVRGGTPGKDSVLIRAMPGELVVPTPLVSAGAVDHLRGHIPGFAAGGFVPSYSGSVPGLQPWVTNNTNAQIKAFGQDMASSLLSAMRAATAAAGSGGAGVARWAPLVLQVLGMLGQPAADLGVVLRQMNTESGGNPMAINLTDSNAAAGDPSRGLMQTIMSTFLAYAGPFRSRGIYDPEANIYAGLNYALHRYGAGWTSVLGQGHGYKNGLTGGIFTRPTSILVGEGGQPERVDVTPLGRGHGSGGGPVLHIENYNSYTGTDEQVLAQKLSFAIAATGLS